MSESDSDAKRKPAKRPIEILEPGVSRVEPAKQRFRNVTSVLIRLSLAIMFLMAGVGAVVYSVINSVEADKSRAEQRKVHKQFFDFFHDQSSTSGVLTIERRILEDSQRIDSKIITKIGTSWIQDETNRRIVHKVGLEESDWQFTFFVFKTFSLLVTNETCIRDSTRTYESFLEEFGLSFLPAVRREKIILEEGRRPINVQLYQGEPDHPHRSNTVYGHFTNSTPYFATAFEKLHQGIVYGWQVHFQPNNNSDILWMEYWFPEMNEYLPETTTFFDYPSYCLV